MTMAQVIVLSVLVAALGAVDANPAAEEQCEASGQCDVQSALQAKVQIGDGKEDGSIELTAKLTGDSVKKGKSAPMTSPMRIRNISALQSPLLLTQANEMLMKDLAVHREKVSQWKASHNRTLLTKRVGVTGTCGSDTCSDWYAKQLKAQVTASGYDVVRTSTATGVASVLAVISQGGDAASVVSTATTAASGIIGAAASLASPLLGLAITFATTLLKGLLPSGDTSNPMAELYEKIMEQVSSMIQSALIQAKLQENRDTLMGIAEEIAWVPELVEELNSESIMVSYYLTLQHDLAVNARAVFGDCYDNEGSNDCVAWQKAGTVEVSYDFAQVHLQTLADLYGSTSHQGFHQELATKIYTLTKKYRCLLTNSYTQLLDDRATKLQWLQQECSGQGTCADGSRRRRRRTSCGDSLCCSYRYKMEDKFTNVAKMASAGWSAFDGTSKVDGKNCGKTCPELCAEAKVDLKESVWGPVRDGLEANIKAPIDALTSQLNAADYNAPCSD